ncbi:MAG: hypothetical protein L3J67_05855 [Hyphomicrobiaceae bacterium]|nr:hypothetical protein [Hyphomicrobiaceae bacterium]
MLDQIRCPTCHVQLLSRRAIKSPDKCYNCGRNLNSPSLSKRDIADELFEKYGDERAAKTKWTAIETSAANFDTHKLRKTRAGTLVFKPTLANTSIGAFFLVLSLFAYSLAYLFTYNKGWWQLLVLFPLLFVGTGLYAMFESMTPLRLDQKRGFFILGWKKEDGVWIDEIKAVQLLPYRTTQYTNFQINLVLADHSRKPVVTYFRRDKALRDADLLAAHLGVPLWKDLSS